MITVDIGGGELRVRGHAGYGAKGRDILCAAVSTLVYTYSLYLEDTGNLERSVTEPGEGDVVPMDAAAPGAMEVHRAVVGMLKALEKDYPECLSVRRETETNAV